MKMTKRLMALLLAMTMVLSLAACGGSTEKPAATDAAAEAPAAEKSTYRTLYSSEVTTLNYLITTQENEMSIAANVVDCLVEYDAYGTIQPALAESWTQNEDATVWTFTLRDGLKWVDKDGNVVGDVKAQDFVTSAHYVCDAANAASGASNYTNVIAGAEAYNDWTAYQLALPNAKDGTDENGNAVKIVTDEDGEESILEEVPEAKAEDIGVKALDDKTIEYTLTKPRAYFLSMVSFGAYMPTSADLLAQTGDKFGTSNEYLWYCGAYILSDYQPQVQRVMTKNPHYWEPETVFIDTIEQKYNAEASSVSTTMYLDGTVDDASISSELLTAMMADPTYAEDIHPSRNDVSYSWWYLFNFDPNFDEEYEPDNWNLAVNNENFRLAVYRALNRIPALACHDPIDPMGFMNNTITPKGFAAASKDFTAYADLSKYTQEYYFNTDEAVKYRDLAKAELEAAGATFPIKTLMIYNPTSTNWANESQVVEQGLEEILGTDFIDIIVQAGPETGFLNERRAGNYGLMKCNWGADYADPETWTDPFSPTQKYNYIFKSQDAGTQALYNEYWAMVEAAMAITNDMDARFEAFAKAESFLLEHGFALPIQPSGRSYSMSRLNVFESQYAPFGIAYLRFKDQHLYDDSMNMAEFQAAYAEWQAKIAG